MSKFPLEDINKLRKELKNHPIFTSLEDRDDLVIFMQHHVYAVWDFMSLLKYLQNHVSPFQTPWLPSNNTLVKRFINDIVLEEESDEGFPLGDGTITYISHFNLYTQAMEEIKKSSNKNILAFIDKLYSSDLQTAMQNSNVPNSAKEFMNKTFSYIQSDKPYVVAAAFALGREHIIPDMYKVLLEKMGISKDEAKIFHYYISRHIELDSDRHGPMSLEMLELFCENDERKIQEAKEAAIDAIKARIKFWDGVLEAINLNKNR